MRRSLRIGLVVAVLLLLVVLGGYTAFWFIAAGRLKDGVAEWAQSLRPQKIDLTWRAANVTGFPFAFHLALDDAKFSDHASEPAADITMPHLAASAAAGDFKIWHLTAPAGLQAAANFVHGPPATLAAQTANGTVALNADGSATLWFELAQPKAEAGVALAAKEARLWLSLPPHRPQSYKEPAIGIGLDVHELVLPVVPAPFVNPVDDVALGATVLGDITNAPPRQAAAAWRDSGGTIEVHNFAMRWGELAITGNGTFALDRDLQPTGAFSGGIEGVDQLLRALVAAHRIPPGDASLAGMALAFFSKRGPNGRPQISAPFAMQDGQMFLGPLRLGPVPHITWQ